MQNSLAPDATKPGRWIGVIVPSLPLALGIAATVAVLAIEPGAQFDSPMALFAFNFAFGTLAGTCAAVLAASAFIQRGALAFLFAAVAATIWGFTNLLPVFAAWPDVAVIGNVPLTIANIGAWLTSLAFLAAIVSATRGVLVPPTRRSALLASSIVAAALAMTAIYWLALHGWFRPFLAHATGGTVLRQLVLVSGACIFLLSAALIPPQRMAARRFHFWFVLSALLFAEGLVAIAFLAEPTLLLAWIGRALQWLATFYMVIGLWFAHQRRARADAVVVVGDDRLWPILTVALVITAAVVRLLFLEALGDSNPFLTFFLAVLLAAMYGGLKAGFVATVISAMAGAFLWMEPKYTFYVSQDADLVSIGIFVLTGIFIAGMAEALRRANQRAQAAEIEAAARRARVAEDELRLSSVKLKRLVESNIIGIAFADTERVLEANEAFLRIVGYDPDDVRLGALDWRRLTPPEWRETDKHARAMLLAYGSCAAYRKEFLRKDGARVPVLVGAAMIGDPGEYVCFVQDLSDITRAEDRLKEADRRKDEFLATLAHELRNPMAPIRTAVEILKRVEDPPKRQSVLDMMDRQVRHMVRLIDDLLDVSRISRGKLQLQLQRTSLLPCIEHAIEACHGAMHSRGQRLDVELPTSPLFVNGDSVRLAQVVSNLLLNASKYSPAGTIITVSAEARDGEAAVLVKDRGIGLKPKDLKTIFELFNQVEPRGTARDGGLGIGLHLVKQLVEMHGGRILARSEGPGKGSEFEVRLPLLAEVPDASVAPPVSVGQPTERV
ncbi:MAG: ATP-binding protein [Betaproteobacteria bacterium]